MTCHMWMSHITYECVMSHMNESGHINESCSHVNEAGNTCQSCMSHPRVMPHMNESYCTYPSAMSRAFTIGTLRIVTSSSSSLSFKSPSHSRYSWELLLYHEWWYSDLSLLLHHESRSCSPTVDAPSPTPFCWHSSLGDLGHALSRDVRVEKKDRHWVGGMDTQADSKTIRRLGWCQQNQREYRWCTVSTQNIVFFMFWRNLNYLHKIRN